MVGGREIWTCFLVESCFVSAEKSAGRAPKAVEVIEKWPG